MAQSNIQEAANGEPRLLSLPPEMRNTIYEYVVASEPHILFGTDHAREPAFLQVNRQIRSEASSIYYQCNKFLIETPDFDPRPFKAWFEQSRPWLPLPVLKKKMNVTPVFLLTDLHGSCGVWDGVMKYAKWVHETTLSLTFEACKEVGPVFRVAAKVVQMAVKLRAMPWEEAKEVLELTKYVSEQRMVTWI